MDDRLTTFFKYFMISLTLLITLAMLVSGHILEAIVLLLFALFFTYLFGIGPALVTGVSYIFILHISNQQRAKRWALIIGGLSVGAPVLLLTTEFTPYNIFMIFAWTFQGIATAFITHNIINNMIIKSRKKGRVISRRPKLSTLLLFCIIGPPIGLFFAFIGLIIFPN